MTVEPPPPGSPMVHITADVLILGAGLSGLRAALSCLLAAPGLDVLVASQAHGPSGSSFSNLNDALGIHAPLTDAEREEYVREVTSLNRDALLSGRLLAIQAQEAGGRLDDLAELGFAFVRNQDGSLARHSSCFSPNSQRAYVFNGLAQAYACFRNRLDTLGCRFLTGYQAAAISGGGTAAPGFEAGPSSGNTPCALLVPMDGGDPLAVAAKAVIVALGGPARLFAHSMAGPNPGYSHGLLLEAGARMANLGYLQYMWGSVPGKRFWQPAETGQGGWRLQASPPAAPLPLEQLLPELSHLAASRAGHCPFGYGLEDSLVDLTLAQALDGEGTVTLIRPDGSPLRVAPMAHASNGGAVIDEHGRTSLPGVLAVGECATGMHGSNRMGGGMVLATQVFGHRAGREAARMAAARMAADQETSRKTDDTLQDMAARLVSDGTERAHGLAWLGAGLSRYAVLGGRPGHEAFAAEVRDRLQAARDWRLRLSLRAAQGILTSLPAPALPE